MIGHRPTENSSFLPNMSVTRLNVGTIVISIIALPTLAPY